MLLTKSGSPSGSPECIELRIDDLRTPFDDFRSPQKNRLHWTCPKPGLDLRMKTDN
jgi:hypothetical protein